MRHTSLLTPSQTGFLLHAPPLLISRSWHTPSSPYFPWWHTPSSPYFPWWPFPRCSPRAQLNGYIEALNEGATDKRFEGGAASDHLTHEEIASLARLGTRTKTLILLLITCGRLRGLDSRAAPQPGQSAGGARYRLVAGSS